MAKAEAYIYVQEDGVPLHRHPGADKLHGSWVQHGTAAETKKLHAHPLLKADYEKLTDEQKADYDSGEDLSSRWKNRHKSDTHKANVYKPRNTKTKIAAVKAAEAIISEPLPDALQAALVGS